MASELNLVLWSKQWACVDPAVNESDAGHSARLMTEPATTPSSEKGGGGPSLRRAMCKKRLGRVHPCSSLPTPINNKIAQLETRRRPVALGDPEGRQGLRTGRRAAVGSGA